LASAEKPTASLQPAVWLFGGLDEGYRFIGLDPEEIWVEFGALVSAAERYFGSWGRALHAAGINPNLHFRSWRMAQEVNKSSVNCDTPKPALARVKVSQGCDWSIAAIMAEETNGRRSAWRS
jgi:lambda repressor-like predicted transcriptional regulator